MTRGGRHKETDGPERRCIATGESQPRDGLIRFVVGPEGQVVPDLAEKLPGRGMWVAADRKALRQAAEKGLFSRAAKAQVTVPGDFLEALERLLVERVAQLLALARKGGAAVCGYEKVKSALEGEDVRLLLQASDGSEAQKRKLWTPTGARFFECLTAQELGLAFGRDRVIHAAVKHGGLAESCLREAARLRGVRVEDVQIRKRKAPAAERLGQE